MNGPHDVGGMMGFGPVVPEPNEPIFHAEWEARVLGLTLCAGAVGGWNLDQSRFARENRHPVDYYGSSYYEIWTKGLEALLVERGMVSPDELAAGTSHRDPDPERVERVLTADRVPTVLRRGGPTDRDVPDPPLFSIGDEVMTRNIHPPSHTRLPRYARHKRGTITAVNGAHVFPDSNALGLGEDPRWLYTVAFDGTELWGEAAEPGLVVSIDAWEPYLEALS